MFSIKTMNHISKAGLSQFPSDQYSISEKESSPDALFVRSANLHEYKFEPSLQAIARAGAGVNNIPISECIERGIVVFNTPGANANAVKELVLAALLLSSRRIPESLTWVQQQKERSDIGKLCEKNKAQFAGPELQGKSLGVIGLGAIGVQVANAAVHLGMDVYGYDPFVSLKSAWDLSRHVKHFNSLDELLKHSDYLTIHVPATPDTFNIIQAQSIEKMKNGVRIINLARGELVNNADLTAAVKSGKVGRYVTDFADPLLIGKENIIVFPHLGASTPESETNCATMAAQELMDYLEDGNITYSVNLPDASMPKTGSVRVCVIHKNIASMLSNISTAVSQSGCNIANLINKSRNEYAYTMIDLDFEPENIEQKLLNISGVIRVRIIK